MDYTILMLDDILHESPPGTSRSRTRKISVPRSHQEPCMPNLSASAKPLLGATNQRGKFIKKLDLTDQQHSI